MNIYSSVDNVNIDKIICLFNSVWLNSDKEKKNNLKFYLLVDSIPETMQFIPGYIKERLLIKSLDLDNKWTELLINFNNTFYKKSNWCKNNMNFARFVIFNHFPELDRVIYLDWDMVVQEDIFKLTNEYNKIDKMVVAKCRNQSIFDNIFTLEFRSEKNYNSLFTRSSKFKKKYQKGYKIMSNFMKDPMDSHNINGFNAGFYIVSRKHLDNTYMITLLDKLISIQEINNCFNFGTQVVMNLMFINERIYIDNSWNTLPEDNCSNIKIIHYNGKNKPWNVNEQREIDKIWLKYYTYVYPDKKPIISPIKKNIENSINKKKIINKHLLNFLIN